MARPLLRLFTAVLIASMVVIGAGVAPALAGPEGSFVKKVNSARKSAGKAPVQVYWDLTDDARRHARNMAKKHQVYPNPNIGSATSNWKAITEVNGAGPSVNVLFNAFMSSYRSTILGSYNYIGVGVVIDESDIMWVSMIFMRGPDGLVEPPDTTTTTKPPATTTTATPSPTTTTEPPATTTTAASAAAPATTSAPEPVAAVTPNTDRLDFAPITSLPPAPTTTEAAVPAAPSSTTSTTSAPAPAAAPESPSGQNPASEDVGTRQGGVLSDWRMFGILSVVAAAALLLVAAFSRRSVQISTARSAASVLFDACSNCGLVFNQARADQCPRCDTAPA